MEVAENRRRKILVMISPILVITIMPFPSTCAASTTTLHTSGYIISQYITLFNIISHCKTIYDSA